MIMISQRHTYTVTVTVALFPAQNNTDTDSLPHFSATTNERDVTQPDEHQSISTNAWHLNQQVIELN